MTLTASGGPFRDWSRERIAEATPREALAHPNWSMGPKVSIDSASLMNKGLELIEASHLFGIGADRLDVLVHRQSIVHGLVSFVDGSVTAGLASPDMRTPIAHCLAWPRRTPSGALTLDLAAIGQLTFERPDHDRFPALRVAIEALEAGGGEPTILNAANEIAVAAFLAGRISFPQIASLVANVLAQARRAGETAAPTTVEEALAVDHNGRLRARALLA
jgi:1-deoxy-D-xylulose-5-phosphate reductoisomerase